MPPRVIKVDPERSCAMFFSDQTLIFSNRPKTHTLSAWERTALQAPPAGRAARQSLAGSAFPGGEGVNFSKFEKIPKGLRCLLGSSKSILSDPVRCFFQIKL